MDSLQVGSPYKLVLRKTIEGGIYLESILHKYFHYLHKSGEWFRSDGELKMFINNKCNISLFSIEMYFMENNMEINKNLLKYLRNLNTKRWYL